MSSRDTGTISELSSKQRGQQGNEWNLLKANKKDTTAICETYSKLKKKETKTMCEMCLKVTIKTQNYVQHLFQVNNKDTERMW